MAKKKKVAKKSKDSYLKAEALVAKAEDKVTSALKALLAKLTTGDMTADGFRKIAESLD